VALDPTFFSLSDKGANTKPQLTPTTGAQAVSHLFLECFFAQHVWADDAIGFMLWSISPRQLHNTGTKAKYCGSCKSKIKTKMLEILSRSGRICGEK